MLHRPEDLTPIYLAVAEAVSRRLPPEIAERVVWSRKAIRHGSKTDMVLFNAWDKWQTGLERNQFNYCLNYKPLRPEDDGRIWLLQIRCNIERIAKTYPTVRDAVRLQLRRLKTVRPSPFVYRENTQTVELRHTFDFDANLDTLPALLVPLFTKLVAASHPVLVRALDLFHGEATDGVPSEPVGRLTKKLRDRRIELAEFSTTLTKGMKTEILSRYENNCARCGRAVQKGDLEFHHLIFKSKGGRRKVDNFAPLHIDCHDEVHRLADRDGVLPPGILRLPALVTGL